MATIVESTSSRRREILESAVIRFAGDSGDGMQITGSQFTNTTALFGNDLATFPDYPAEIRAPAGTLPGVSGFQIHFGASDVYTPGDAVDVLVAMNPAALKVNLRRPQDGRDPDRQHGRLQRRPNLEKARLHANPLEDGTLEGYRVFAVEHHEADRARARRTSASTRRAWTGARTSSRSGCATGSTTGRWTPTLRGSTRSSRRSRRWPRRTRAR